MIGQDLNASLPLFALDADVLLATLVPKYKIFARWTKRDLVPNIDAEYCCVRLRERANVALLSQYSNWQNDLIKETIDIHTHNYMISCRTKDEFELFRDQYHPYLIVSNIPRKLWQGEYSDVREYSAGKTLNAFNIIRESIHF